MRLINFSYRQVLGGRKGSEGNKVENELAHEISGMPHFFEMFTVSKFINTEERCQRVGVNEHFDANVQNLT